MTSEVAVMNSQAIALAADSAVTFREGRGQKIFTSACKIFTLSKYQPVGVMIFGNANFMGVPWETIIKIYRYKLSRNSFKTVGDYAMDFLSFLREEEQLLSEPEQTMFIKRTIYGYFDFIRKEIRKEVEKAMEGDGIDEVAVKKKTSQIIQQHFETWRDAELLPSVPTDFATDFRSKYRTQISEAKKIVFGELPLTRQSSRHLTETAINLFRKYPAGMLARGTSGVVIAGFGTEDIFPVLESFAVEGRVDNCLKQRRENDTCKRIYSSTDSAILGFAQSEMVFAFMEGIDHDYQNEMDKFMRIICSSFPLILVDSIQHLDNEEKESLKDRLIGLGEEFLDSCRRSLSEYREENYTSPVLQVVQALPKDELAAMAESLINLTSFKRRVSLEDETVGGPIDVAVISKGDGFIWIKRKHYFDAERNPQFFANYFREDQTDDSKENEETSSESIPLNERD